MPLYTIPPAQRPVRPPRDPAAPRDYWAALLDEGQVELFHDPADPHAAPLGYAEPVLEERGGQTVAVAYALGTPEERDAERLRQWRETAVLGPFEARAALLATGQLTAVEALMADPATPDLVRLAWTTSTVFPRTSPAIAVLGAALGWSEAQLDALFQAGATSQVMAQLAAAVPAPAPETPPEPPPADDPPPVPDAPLLEPPA
jgi:hypothetical protein